MAAVTFMWRTEIGCGRFWKTRLKSSPSSESVFAAGEGADRVLDYTTDDFADGSVRYDLVFDIGGNPSLERLRRAELERGVCLAGPHRDELELRIGDLPARGYASHGESWSLALALRLAAFGLLWLVFTV